MHGPTFFTFLPDLEKSGSVGRPTPPDFFLRQIDFFPHFTALTRVYLSNLLTNLIIKPPQEESPPPQAKYQHCHCRRCRCRHCCHRAALKQFCHRCRLATSLPTAPLPRRRCCQAAAAAAPLPPSLLPPTPLLRCPRQCPVAAANVKDVTLFSLSALPLSLSSFPSPLPPPLLVDC